MSRLLCLAPPAIENLKLEATNRRVVTPNARAARALDAPPCSLESLAKKELVACGLAIASAYAAHKALSQAARSIPEISDSEGATEAFSATVRELFRAGVDLEALSLGANERARRLAHLAIAYRTILRERGLLDPAEVYWLAAAQRPVPQALLITGYPRFGPDEQAFIHAIAGDGSVLYLPFAESGMYEDARVMAQAFAAQGWTVSSSDAASTSLPFGGHLHRAQEVITLAYPDMETEVRGVLASVKRLLRDGVDPAEIVIVARDDAFYGPTLLATAWEYEVSVCAFYQLPLTGTRLGTWLTGLRRSVESGFSYEETYRFLAHSLSPFLTSEQRARVRADHPIGLGDWADIQPPAAKLDWPASDTRVGWIRRFRSLLTDWDLRGRAMPWPVELMALYRFRDALKEIESPTDERLTSAAFLDELTRLAGFCSVEAHPARGGVELHTPLSLFGARIAHVFVLGVAEEHLPQRVKDDAVLDFHARKRLAAENFKLEGAAEAARRENLSIGQLLEVATERLVLSYPKLMNDRATLPSALFEQLGLKPDPAPEHPAASLEEARRIWVGLGDRTADPLVSSILEAVEVERRREASALDAVEDPHDGYSGIPIDLSKRTFSASQLSILGQCAFRWFAERELSAAPPDEAGADLDASMRGTLYHKTLELGMRRCKDAPDVREALLKGLDATFREAERELALPELPLWEVRREEHLKLLRRAIASEAFLLEGARPERFEQDFTFDWHGFRLKGSMDRVDLGPDGYIIVDYKAGKRTYGKIQDAAGKADVDIQLPIYVQAGTSLLGPVAAAYYFMLSTGEAIQADTDDAPLKPLLKRMRKQLEAGHFPVQPDTKRTVCKYCPVILACRVGPRLERKARFS